eukprot:gnl/TRDRNA2_/TRDRNA2_171808_c7_seq6.p1 gnl/TRDRNA2_/TRDRNA2_171808_c7~~gnl/TRDRNA2_/TRDRNA2_171808_c7_seq6.p1  ORF type:complete len:263 (-),score=78.47 gnl/TRDRNA2_/TRDRNA2_171808_c7_seq6:96-884(-)
MAILLCQMLREFVVDESQDLKVRQDVFALFGTYTNALLTMFEITLGNWVVACRVLYTGVSQWYGGFIVVYRCCLMFAVLKVITAVFIAETVRCAASDDEVAFMKKRKEKQMYCKKMHTIFKELDTSGDGALSRAEFEPMISDEAVQTLLQTLEIDTHDLETLFKILDDGDGVIDLDEFIDGVNRMKGQAKSIDVVSLLKNHHKIAAKLDRLLAADERSNFASKAQTDLALFESIMLAEVKKTEDKLDLVLSRLDGRFDPVSI